MSRNESKTNRSPLGLSTDVDIELSEKRRRHLITNHNTSRSLFKRPGPYIYRMHCFDHNVTRQKLLSALTDNITVDCNTCFQSVENVYNK